MQTGKVIIKKYGNRRLYDTSGSRYVNLEDIAALIRNGNDVQVIDAKTAEDLTRVTLTQIILEDAKGQSSGLPLEMLRQLVMATDRVGRDFLMSYLKSAFEAYQKVQNSVQSTLSEVQAAAFSPLQTVRRIVQGEPRTGPFQPTERTGHPTAQDELKQLRARLAELEARMTTPKRTNKR
ncbi:MAG: polyhydroxyalkanoate synthesis regulator DNA-binding domain-containing protein, partial [Terriglobales bacterium]